MSVRIFFAAEFILLWPSFAVLCDSNCILSINEIEECGYVCLNVCASQKAGQIGSSKSCFFDCNSTRVSFNDVLEPEKNSCGVSSLGKLDRLTVPFISKKCIKLEVFSKAINNKTLTMAEEFVCLKAS